jgi:hypothetical protein
MTTVRLLVCNARQLQWVTYSATLLIPQQIPAHTTLHFQQALTHHSNWLTLAHSG